MKIRLTEKGKKVVNQLEIPEAVRERFDSIFREGTLALFMTYGMSLKKWDEAGILVRELKPYIEMAKELKMIYIISYGSWTTEYKYQEQLPKNIIILCNNSNLPGALYSLLAPWIHRAVLNGVDYLKSNQMAAGWTAVMGKKVLGKKLIIRQGYPWLRTLEEKKAPVWKKVLAGLTEKLAYGAADKIIVTTDRDKTYIEKNYPVSEEKVHVIPNYIDTDLFKPDPAPRIPNRLLYVGRMEPEKNLINLIRAVNGLEVELILIGDGSMKPQLEILVAENGIRNVKFLGRVANELLVQEYNKAEIYIQPSIYEGNPKTIMEAMACGCLVIGSNVRGIKELIVHEITGFLCETAESTIRGTILYAIMFSIGSNNVAEQIRKQAREEIVSNHSLKNTVRQELRILRQRPIPLS